MNSLLGFACRLMAASCIKAARRSASVQAAPRVDRRLATYRGCLFAIEQNIAPLEAKLKRTRTREKKERLACLIEIWRDLARYFERAIRTRCGERF